jgi:hypothetical protein
MAVEEKYGRFREFMQWKIKVRESNWERKGNSKGSLEAGKQESRRRRKEQKERKENRFGYWLSP